MLSLRPYQRAAVDAVYRYLREHDDNPVVVIPTAGGKTPLLATICRDAVDVWDGRVLVVSHVKELLEQAVDKLKLVAPELPVGVYSAGLGRRGVDRGIAPLRGLQPSPYARARRVPQSRGKLDCANGGHVSRRRKLPDVDGSRAR